MFFWESDFVPGRPGTEVFVLGHLLLPLSRDKGTPGQEIIFVLGQRDDRLKKNVEFENLQPGEWRLPFIARGMTPLVNT